MMKTVKMQILIYLSCAFLIIGHPVVAQQIVESEETETIISSEDFLESVKYRAKDLGRQSTCKYAEGFITHQLPKLDTLKDIK